METQAKTLLSPNNDNNENTDNPSSQHLTVVKYLPVSAFKTPLTLSQSLDQISIEIRSLGSKNINSILTNLANNIALTTIDLTTDYRTKIDMMDAARLHPIFNNQYKFIKLANLILRMAKRKHFKPLFQTEAQAILQNTITTIKRKTDGIILC